VAFESAGLVEERGDLVALLLAAALAVEPPLRLAPLPDHVSGLLRQSLLLDVLVPRLQPDLLESLFD